MTRLAEFGCGAPLEPGHTDWLYHHLSVSGPEAVLARFREEARGPGTIPWQLDLDQMEEDWLHLLLAPPAPQRRTLSLDGARILAGQLREAVGRRHAIALAEADQSGEVRPLDLHRLVPVPPGILKVGPDAPDARAWLWQHWGTTLALRHVGALPGDGALRFSFWSADWSPWRAFAVVQTAWPALRFDLRPQYEAL